MTDREKLIELLDQCDRCNAEYCNRCEFGKDIDGCILRRKQIIADHLLANGVTVQQWIPVTERLPEELLETVLVSNGKSTCVGVYSLVHDQFGVMCGRSRKAGKSFGVTHWMPLPEPPKGE